MIEVARIHFVINVSGTRYHVLTREEDAELVGFFVRELSEKLGAAGACPFTVGAVTFERGCLVIDVAFLLEAGKKIYEILELLATVGGAIAFFQMLHEQYRAFTVRYRGRNYRGTVMKKKVQGSDELVEELYNLAREDGLSREEIKKRIDEMERARRHGKKEV